MQIFAANEFLSLFGTIIIGGVIAYFLIKYQINKNLHETLLVYKEELEAYKSRVETLERQVAISTVAYEELKKKKNYLKQILLEALQTKRDIKEILEGSIKDVK